MGLMPPPRKVIYPDSDGLPMAENTRQYEWIVTIKGNLDVRFKDAPDVFVAGDNLWYPVEGHPEIRLAPDVYVAFGRPKGDRGSYMQWEEEGIPLTVVFEVLSPGSKNQRRDRELKLKLYAREGVDEYWLIDWSTQTVEVYRRTTGDLQHSATLSGSDELTSPLLPSFGLPLSRLWMPLAPGARDQGPEVRG